jgi:hypothetical protein
MAKKLLVPAACLLLMGHAPSLARDAGQARNGLPGSAPVPATRPHAVPLPKPADLDSLPKVGTAGHKLLGQMSPAGNATFGIGIFRVEKDDRYDPNRGAPIQNRSGRLSGIAAVGFNIGF